MQTTEIIEGKLADPERFERPTLRFVVSHFTHDLVGGWTEPDQKPAERSPDDFCRTCRGKGYLVDQEYRPGIGMVSVSETCWACNGSGYGR